MNFVCSAEPRRTHVSLPVAGHVLVQRSAGVLLQLLHGGAPGGGQLASRAGRQRDGVAVGRRHQQHQRRHQTLLAPRRSDLQFI